MSIRVRRHQRRTASGKTTTVREHERSGDAASPYVRDGDDIYERHPDGSSERLTPPEWWASNEPADGEHEWQHETAEGTELLPVDPSVPRCAEDRGAWGGEPEGWDDGMSPAFRKMVAQNPALADGFREFRALRESGYSGPVDQDGKPAGTPGEIRTAKRTAQHRAQSSDRATSEAASSAWHQLDEAERDAKSAAVRELREARAELERVSKRDREETEDYHRANGRVIEAEKHVLWWRRW